ARAAALNPARVWTRSMFRDVSRARLNNQLTIDVSDTTFEELLFWSRNIESVNGSPIVDPIHSIELNVDAGEVGFGGHTEQKSVAGPLPTELIGTSST